MLSAEIQGNYAYIVTEAATNNFDVYDISDPTNPSLVSSSNINSSVNDLIVRGNRAYVVDIADNLVIVDISDPESPVVMGTVSTASAVFGIAVQGNYAYLTSDDFAGSGELEVFDISNPASPVKVSGVAITDGAETVVVAGSYAYVTSYESGQEIKIYDISDPTNLVKVGDVVEVGTAVYDLALVDTYLYAGTPLGVSVYDVSSTSNPIFVASTDLANGGGPLTVSGNAVYVTSFNGAGDGDFQILDLGGLITPTAEIGYLLANEIETDFMRVTQALTADSLNVNTNALIGGSLTITGSASSSLLSGNTNPALVVTSGYVGVGTTTPYADLSIAGDLRITGGLYDSTASLGTSGQVLQTDGTNVTWVATSSLNVGDGSLFTDDGDITYLNSLTDVVIIGDYAYVAAEVSDGLQIIDVSDPTNPVAVGSVTDGNNDANTLNGATGIAVRGNYAYISAQDDNGVQILDISDPTNPVGVGAITDDTNGADTLGGAGWDIAVQGNYAYATAYGDGGV
jgi:hypothetical protein